MSLLRPLRDRAVTTIQSLPRRARRRLSGAPVEVEPLRLISGAGYQINAMIYRPKEVGRWPGVLICPGTCDPGTVFQGWTQPINAMELAATGATVLIFDPAGRGESWGEEDYGGPEHQDNVRVALLHLASHRSVDPDRVGVLSISLGLSMACGALARWGDELPARWLVDWEGPCDREIITAGGTIMAPALGHSLKDEVYWRPREATRHVGQLRCGYWRIQSQLDHAQPGEFRHAERMLKAAAAGSLPWFQINDHPRNVVPDVIQWLPPGRMEANRVLMRVLGRCF